MAEVIFEKAKKVSSPLNISLNGGTAEGTNKFTYDGSSTKTLNITPASIGAAASNHSHSLATTSANGFLSSEDKTKINSIGTPSTLITTSKQLVGAINEVKTNFNGINNWSIDISETVGQHGNDINHLLQETVSLQSFVTTAKTMPRLWSGKICNTKYNEWEPNILTINATGYKLLYFHYVIGDGAVGYMPVPVRLNWERYIVTGGYVDTWSAQFSFRVIFSSTAITIEVLTLSKGWTVDQIYLNEILAAY